MGDAVPTVLARIPDEGDEMVFDVVAWGDPYEILERSGSPEVIGYVVSVEGWDWPSTVSDAERAGRPSDHPDRVEVRSVVAVTGSGEVVSLTRERGEDEPLLEHGGEGPLVEAMRVALQHSVELSGAEVLS